MQTPDRKKAAPLRGTAFAFFRLLRGTNHEQTTELLIFSVRKQEQSKSMMWQKYIDAQLAICLYRNWYDNARRVQDLIRLLAPNLSASTQALTNLPNVHAANARDESTENFGRGIQCQIGSTVKTTRPVPSSARLAICTARTAVIPT